MEKCVSCQKLAPVFRKFWPHACATNRYAGRRKPTVWCELCWKTYEKFENDKRAAEEAELHTILVTKDIE